MKIIFFILFLFLNACAALEPKTTSEAFADLTFKGCSLRYGANTEYCNCYSKILESSVSEQVKQGFLNEEASAKKAVTTVILESTPKTKKCDQYLDLDLSIIETEDTDVLKKTLSENEGSIITPELAKNIDYSDLKLGFEYSMASTSNSDSLDKTVSTMRLTEINENEFFFSIVKSNGQISHKNLVLLKEGKLYIRSRDKQEYKRLNYWDDCKFVEGMCSIVSSSGKVEVIYSEYSNGVWLRNMNRSKRLRRPVKEVYDKYGLPLYYYTKSLLVAERARVIQ